MIIGLSCNSNSRFADASWPGSAVFCNIEASVPGPTRTDAAACNTCIALHCMRQNNQVNPSGTGSQFIALRQPLQKVLFTGCIYNDARQRQHGRQPPPTCVPKLMCSSTLSASAATAPPLAGQLLNTASMCAVHSVGLKPAQRLQHTSCLVMLLQCVLLLWTLRLLLVLLPGAAAHELLQQPGQAQ